MSVKLMSAIFETEFRDLQDEEGNVTKASTAKLVLLALADHANDEGEGAYPGLTKMERKTALSRQTVINTYGALKYNGIIFLAGISKRNTNNYTINIKAFPKAGDDSQPILLVNPLDQSTDLTSTSQVALPELVNPLDPNHPLTINKSSIRKTDETKGKYRLQGIEAAIFAGRPVTEEDMEEKTIRAACNEFESALGFGSLPWDSTADWTALRKFVVKLYQTDAQEFRKFDTWRKGDGKYQGCTNKSIRENPRIFIDTHHPTFKASTAMYVTKKTDEGKGFYA